jgi:hypothetical protein
MLIVHENKSAECAEFDAVIFTVQIMLRMLILWQAGETSPASSYQPWCHAE